ncbi:MAG: hypothetical protein DSM106950_00540 [Stigonema ocellatum SAG 48.90 = DSM 106950]|nr:hypothetical protein [Stigonema ocellatum SAG 48.90 = DSM 106950]
MGFFNWLFNWFRNLMSDDSPQIPWRWGNWEVESLFDNPHTQPLAVFLDALEPQLLAQWYASVAPASSEAKKAAIALNEICLAKNEVAAKLADLEVVCDEGAKSKNFLKRNDIHGKNGWEWLLTIGLSRMLFLGIAEPLQIDMDMENLSSGHLLLFSLGLLGAICLTVTKVALKELMQEVEEQKRFVQDLRKLAQQEHQRWETTVKRCFRRWCNADPKRLERFKQFYSQLNEQRGSVETLHNVRQISKSA